MMEGISRAAAVIPVAAVTLVLIASGIAAANERYEDAVDDALGDAPD